MEISKEDFELFLQFKQFLNAQNVSMHTENEQKKKP